MTLTSPGCSIGAQWLDTTSIRVSLGINFSIPPDIAGGRAASLLAAMNSTGISMTVLSRLLSINRVHLQMVMTHLNSSS